MMRSDREKSSLSPFSPSGRLAGLQRKMAAEGLDLAVYGAGPDLQYLTGLELDWRSASPGDASVSHLFVPAGGMPVLTLPAERGDCAFETWVGDVSLCEDRTRYGALVKLVLGALGAGGGGAVAAGPRVAAVVAGQLATACGGAVPRDAAGLADRLRLVKDAVEIERLREVAGLTGRVMAAVAPAIVEGVTQGEIEAEIACQGVQFGASGVSFAPTVRFTRLGSQPGPDPFTWPEDEGLVSGTSIAFDFGFVKDGYCSDFGRSLYFGPAGAEVRKGYEALHAGLIETVGRMHEPGMRVCDLFGILAAVLDARGYGPPLRARLPNGVLGHSIGVDVHEYPWLSPACDEPLCVNMVLALEPKVWHAGQYYLRVEDMVLIGPDRAEFLTRFDREFFEL